MFLEDEISNKMGLHAVRDPQNRDYGANQKTCYQEANVVVMLHRDYQYTPKLVVAMASMIRNTISSWASRYPPRSAEACRPANPSPIARRDEGCCGRGFLQESAESK